jgi:mRNA interferase HigB
MRLLTRRTIEGFAAVHPEAQQPLADLCLMLEAARWSDADHLRASSSFPARPIGDKRVVFNVKGNDYRVIVSIQYANIAQGHNGVVRVHFVGTHAEYDRVDPLKVDHFGS